MTLGCSVSECVKPTKSGGLCSMHYSRLRRWGTVSDRVCENCGADVPPRRSASCSEDCRAAMGRARAAAWYAERRGSPALVARTAEAKKRHYEKTRADEELWGISLAASRDWKAAHRPQTLEAERRWAAANPSKARAKVQRRRARMAEAFVEDVDLDIVFARDGGLCGICGAPVDPALRWPHRMSKTLDHIIPLARGGLHEYANAQLAHAACNSRKNDRLV